MNAVNAISTRGLSREEWLAKRKGSIGASDMASVCGLGYNTPNHTADVISGKVEPEDLSENDAVQIGILTEPANHTLYERKTGRRIHRINEMRYHRDLPFIHANLDRVAYGEKRIVELKNTSEWNARSTYERDVEDAIEALPPQSLYKFRRSLPSTTIRWPTYRSSSAVIGIACSRSSATSR